MNARSCIAPVGSLVLVVLLLAGAQQSLAQCCPPGIYQHPTNQTVYAGSNVTFSVGASSATFMTYQWRFNGTNISGGTSSNYTIFNVQVTNAGMYSVAITNGAGPPNNFAISSNATLTVIGPPMITGQPANKMQTETGNTSFTVAAAGPDLTYQWRFYVTNILTGATNPTLNLLNLQAWHAGNYSVAVANSYGSINSSNAVLTVTLPAGVVGCWGNSSEPASTVQPEYRGGYIAVAAGGAHSLGLRTNGIVRAWGDNTFGQTNVPVDLSNVVSIAAGLSHSLALQNDGTVVAWGDNAFGQTDVPFGLSNVAAIACGAYHSVALEKDGTVVAWGNNFDGETDVPIGLNDVVRIAAGHYHNLALKRDGAIVVWGQTNSGEANIPGGLTGVVDISAGNGFSLALRTNGAVSAWGDNSWGQTNIPPAAATTVAAISAGGYHSVALKENGTVIAWGQNTFHQTNVPFILQAGNSFMTAVSAGANHSLALKGSGAPVITSQPWDQRVNPGANATFAVLATGSGTLTYFWQFNGTTVLAGPNRKLYTRTNAQPPDAGPYVVIVSNASGGINMATSSVASLTVPPPVSLMVLGFDPGGFHVRLMGPPGTYVIEFSPNLSNWIPGQTNIVPPSGFLDLVDPTAIFVNRRAYRAYLQP